MPELPEVETVRASLAPGVTGRVITGLEVGQFAGVLGGMQPEAAAAMLAGRTLTGIRRRGKYLLLDLDDGCGIEIHLRMTGRLELQPAGAPPLRFQHLAIALDDGNQLRFADQRKFGRVIVHPGNPADAIKSKLGPEPLSRAFTAARFSAMLARRTASIKSLLLDQRLIAGIGNIYADEALYLARIHPLRAGGALSEAEVTRLCRAIRRVLRAGISNRGTSFSSYRDGLGQEGENQRHLLVYGRGRGGEPCLRCRRPLAYLVTGGRTSHFCPSCQPLDPPSAAAGDA